VAVETVSLTTTADAATAITVACGSSFYCSAAADAATTMDAVFK
jgi:hypothetical protein